MVKEEGRLPVLGALLISIGSVIYCGTGAGQNRVLRERIDAIEKQMNANNDICMGFLGVHQDRLQEISKALKKSK